MSLTAASAGPAQELDQDTLLIRAVYDLQRLVSARASQDSIYDAALQGALTLLNTESGALRLVDRDDPGWMAAVASRSPAGMNERWRQRAPISEGASGQAISTGRLVAIDGGGRLAVASSLAPDGTKATIAVPLHEHGEVTGALVTATRDAGRRWSSADRRRFSAYCAHVEVALTVARANRAVIDALSDPLTGLANRSLLLDRLHHRLAQADRGGRAVTVLFLDLDRFKLVNDSLGHVAGDQLLIAVAERLRGCLRSGDVCARLGGDEFAILLGGGVNSTAVARRIIGALERAFLIDGREVFVGASVGIATGRQEAETLLRNADVAMYHAKRSGTGRVERFKPRMHAALVSRLALESELRRAVEREEFELHFQPLVDLRTRRVAGLETLVRWRHPGRGLVAPLEFIPLAEETGLIVEIDGWVMRQACRQFASWWRQAPVSLSINAAMRDLQQPGYAAALEQAIGSGFPASALIVEVTETASVEDAPGALASLHALKELGVRLALDDFGTGYASLLTLGRLPVDLVKIARPFLQAAARAEPRAGGMLAGMIDLGRHLGLVTITEGVETEEELDLLTALGCDMAQGYLLGRPTDAAGAAQRLDGASVAPV